MIHVSLADNEFQIQFPVQGEDIGWMERNLSSSLIFLKLLYLLLLFSNFYIFFSSYYCSFTYSSFTFSYSSKIDFFSILFPILPKIHYFLTSFSLQSPSHNLGPLSSSSKRSPRMLSDIQICPIWLTLLNCIERRLRILNTCTRQR